MKYIYRIYKTNKKNNLSSYMKNNNLSIFMYMRTTDGQYIKCD